MNKVIMFLLNKVVSELVLNDESICINGTNYYLEDGRLFKFRQGWHNQPEKIEYFDYENTDEAIGKFVLYLSKIDDIENISIGTKPKCRTETVWY